jgi:hypothetical protein
MDKAAARNKKAEDEKREKEEAAAAAAAAEAAAAEAATKERKARQVEKKAMQKQRSKLRTLSSSLVSSESHLTVPTSAQACRHASCVPKEGNCRFFPPILFHFILSSRDWHHVALYGFLIRRFACHWASLLLSRVCSLRMHQS